MPVRAAVCIVKQMNISQQAAHNLAQRAVLHGGVTARRDGTTIESYDGWIFPKYPDLTKKVPENRLEPALAEFLEQSSGVMENSDLIGVWREDNEYFIDINIHAATYDDARKIARSIESESTRSIIGVYNPARNETRYFKDD